MAINKKAQFTIKILKQYAKESGNPCRKTTDLSTLEQWLICQLYNDSLEVPISSKLPIEFDTEHDNPF